MYHTFQQRYVDDNKTFYNKYICTWRERMNLLIKEKLAIKNCKMYERSFMCYETDTESDKISITSFSITCWTNLNNTDIPYRTAVHYSYVRTVAVTSDHNPHCTLTALHMTVGSAAITGIAFCDESSLVFW